MTRRRFGRTPNFAHARLHCVYGSIHEFLEMTSQRSGRVVPKSRALGELPNDVDLLGLSDSRFAELADAILRVIRSTLCYNVGLSKATKILHKKRPLLIPILDNVVTEYYDEGPLAGRRFREGERLVEYLRRFRNDLESVGKEVRSIQVSLSNRGTELTHCRILEFLIWKQRMDS